MEEISATASQALSEVREIPYNLRPYQLDRLGLTKAIEGIVKKASGASTIAFTAEIDEIDNAFPKDSEINFYRIVQESVNNVIKHSEATEASVAVRHTTGGVVLTIRDNGKGFTPGATESHRGAGGFGLIGITELAQLLGGKPAVHSAPGQGTVISIEIPLDDTHGK
ncbi:MAG TPA: sensor histidine kinase [Terriglobia bacterium]|nr:sensor histidine kinase [Terriglobia bacterium]